ncbi:MAG TPA: translocation/assembly module TamB domain-containing protein, partial [Polyangiaceae bacterium]|nr:translocation/assembly module TamB domain-containing protein [Polyangiaceae bacterium]
VITLPSENHPYSVETTMDTLLPMELLNRLSGGAPKFAGWAELQGDLRFAPPMRMPEFEGSVTTGEFLLAYARLTEGSEGKARIKDDIVHVPHLRALYGGGVVDVDEVTLEPFAPGVPLHSKKVDGGKVGFPAMMRDIGITPNTIVQWNVDHAKVTEFGGTLFPTKLDGDMLVETSGFEVFDKAYHSPNRNHMIGATPKAVLQGRFAVRNDSIQFNDVATRFGQSQLNVSITIGFDNTVKMTVPESTIQLAEISPLVTVPIAGTATLSAEMNGQLSNPTLTTHLEIENLVFADLPLGHLKASDTVFRPLWVEAHNAELRKNGSVFKIPKARLEFGEGAALKAELVTHTEHSDIRDFLALWRMENDPRWLDIKGNFASNNHIDYVLGGTGDRCASGNLEVNGKVGFDQLWLFDERYDGAESSFDFHWEDIVAGYHGFSLDLPDLELKKGTGKVIGSVHVAPDAQLAGDLVATRLPLSSLQALGTAGKMVTGDVSVSAHLGGSIDEMEADVHADVSPIILGRSRLHPSRLEIQLAPSGAPPAFAPELSRCKNHVPLEVPPEKVAAEDPSSGVFQISGQLLGQQILFDKFSLTRQKHKIAQGGVIFTDFNLGPFLDLLPELGLARQRPSGKFSGRLDLARMPLDRPQATQASAEIGALWAEWKGFRVETSPIEGVLLSGGKLTTPRKITLAISTPDGREASFDASGSLENITQTPTINARVDMQPVSLASWSMLLPSLSEVTGKLQGGLEFSGALSNPRTEGGFTLRDGRFVLQREALTFSDVALDLDVKQNEVALRNLSASMGGGRITGEGRAPLRGFNMGEFRGRVRAQGISLPITEGVATELDAALDVSWRPTQDELDQHTLPKVTGTIDLRSFEYTRPVTMNADLVSASRRGKRTEFESYDPAGDVVDLDLNIRSDRPLKLSNNLLESNLRIDDPGLELTGSNQRFGLRGRVRVEPGGRIRLRRNEFEVQSGEVRFDDANSIAPRVDLMAVTEYRRYSTNRTTEALAANPAAGGTGTTAGQWRIQMHAHGDADNLKIDLSSQPKLSEDDIFLLLTVGLTRTELDQAQSASLGESVALEALGSLTGADEAVTEAIPVIDEFRFGSAYSSRTGRTEPTVTVGKRLTERIRAFVTSGISESREVRSNLEWQLNPRVSVEGSYDNVNDISTSSLGNLGADVRWRLEFR